MVLYTKNSTAQQTEPHVASFSSTEVARCHDTLNQGKGVRIEPEIGEESLGLERLTQKLSALIALAEDL